MIQNLGAIVARMIVINQEENASYEELAQFNASECGTLIAPYWERIRRQFISEVEKALGTTWQEVIAEIESRVSGRWLWITGALSGWKFDIDKYYCLPSKEEREMIWNIYTKKYQLKEGGTNHDNSNE